MDRVGGSAAATPATGHAVSRAPAPGSARLGACSLAVESGSIALRIRGHSSESMRTGALLPARPLQYRTYSGRWRIASTLNHLPAVGGSSCQPIQDQEVAVVCLRLSWSVFSLVGTWTVLSQDLNAHAESPSLGPYRKDVIVYISMSRRFSVDNPGFLGDSAQIVPCGAR